MPYPIGLRVSPSLDPFIIQIPSCQVMAHKQSTPIGQHGFKRNRSFVKRVVKGVEVGPGLEVFERFDWVRDW